MFGTPFLFPLDALIMIWGNVITGIALSLVYLMNHALKCSYSKFHKEMCDVAEHSGLKVRLADAFLKTDYWRCRTRRSSPHGTRASSTLSP